MDLFALLKTSQKFTPEIIQKFQTEYGEKFFKALEFLQHKGTKIKKNCFKPSNLHLWSIEGQTGEYLVYPDMFCQCHSFLMSAIYRTTQFGYCKHLLALKMAEALNNYDTVIKSDDNFQTWIARYYARHNSTNTTI